MLGDLRAAPLESPLEPVAVLPRACAVSATQALPTLTAAMCGGPWPPAFGLAVRLSKITWLAWHFQAHRTSKSGRRPPRQITARERPDRRHWRIVHAPLAPVLRTRTACSSVSLSAGCAGDRRGVCGLHRAAAVAVRGPVGGRVGARPCRAGAQGPAGRAVLPAPLNRPAGLVSAAVAPAPRRPEGHASPGGRTRWPGPAATGREPSARSTAGC